jgi:TatA/E family protein of Tat protein translocase
MPFNIGPGELILILVIALVVLGPGKLPDVAASLGKSLREFRKAATDVSDAAKIDAPASPAAPAAPAAPPANTLSSASEPNTLSSGVAAPTEPVATGTSSTPDSTQG